MATTSLGYVTGSDWVRYATQGLAENEVTLHNSSEHNGTITSTKTFPKLEGTLNASIYMGGDGDVVCIGIVDGNVVPAAYEWGTAWPDSVPPLTPGVRFTGFMLHMYEYGARPFIDGALAGGQGYFDLRANDYRNFTVDFRIEGSTLHLELYCNGAFINSTFGPIPSYSSVRPVINGGSGSATGLFKVQGAPTWEDDAPDYDPSPSNIPVVTHALPLDGGLFAKWDSIPGATSYQWSKDGGATWRTYTPQPDKSNLAKVVGLTNDIPYNVCVRAITSSGYSSWSDPISVTPSASLHVSHFDDFNRPSSTVSVGSPFVGNSYLPGTGDWGISQNQYLYMSTNTDNGRVLFQSTPDFDIEFKNVGMTNAGLIFRATDAQNFWALSYEGNDGWQIWEVVAGKWTYKNRSFPRGTTPYDTIRVLSRGPEVFFYLDGRSQMVFWDDTRTSNSTLGFFADEHTNAKIDDVIVWTVTDDSFYGNLSGGQAHVYKGHDRHSEDTGATP